MKLKPLVLLALALGCGLVAMLGVQQMMAKREAPVQEEMAKVLVALTDISAGVPLDETNVVFKDWPKDQVPPQAILDKAEYDKRALKYSVVSGDLILSTKLGDPGVSGAAASIPMGMRLTTVPITMTAIHSGMVRPGDKVDIICTYTNQEKAKTMTRTRIVLEYVEVFAIDRQRQGTDPSDANKGAKYETLTLLCTPEQEVLIQHAQRKGPLQMALRGKNDKPDGKTKKIAMDDDKFEELDTGKGAETPEEEPVADAGKTGAQGLKEVMAEHQEEEEKKPAEPAADPDQWVIRIYEGGNVREEIVGKPSVTPAKDQAEPSIPTTQKPKSAPQKPKKSTTRAV